MLYQIFPIGFARVMNIFFQIVSSEEFERIRPKSAFDIEMLVLAKGFDKSLGRFKTKVKYEFIISSKPKDAIL